MCLQAKALWVWLLGRLQSQRGQAMSEYGLVLALVALGLVAALVAFRQELAGIFTALTDSLKQQKT